MNIFKSIFSKGNEPAQPERNPNFRARLAHCDLCGRDVPSWIGEDDHFMRKVVLVGDPNRPERTGVNSVGACEGCDIDVCGTCARFVPDTEVQQQILEKSSSHEAREAHTTRELERLFAFACPRCGKLLTGKTAVDLKRLNNRVRALPDLPFLKQREAAKYIVRLFLEEQPVLERIFGAEKLLEMKREMMDLANRRQPAELSPREKRDLLRERIAAFHQGSGDVKQHIDLLRSTDERFETRSARYPAIRRIAHLVDLEKTIDFAKAGTERDALVTQLGNVLDKPRLEALVLKALQFKMGGVNAVAFHEDLLKYAAEAKVDLKPYRNLESYAQYLSLWESAVSAEFGEECRKFEDDLMKDLESRIVSG